MFPARASLTLLPAVSADVETESEVDIMKDQDNYNQQVRTLVSDEQILADHPDEDESPPEPHRRVAASARLIRHLGDDVNLFLLRLRLFLSIVSICHGCNVDALLSSAAISNQFYLTHTKLHCR